VCRLGGWICGESGLSRRLGCWLRGNKFGACWNQGPLETTMLHQCGGSEVRLICVATSSCGLLNQSRTRTNNLPVSFDSEVRKGRRREMMRTSESGHQFTPP